MFKTQIVNKLLLLPHFKKHFDAVVFQTRILPNISVLVVKQAPHNAAI